MKLIIVMILVQLFSELGCIVGKLCHTSDKKWLLGIICIVVFSLSNITYVLVSKEVEYFSLRIGLIVVACLVTVFASSVIFSKPVETKQYIGMVIVVVGAYVIFS